jgi:natural resistance-associated macrophage protein
MASCFFINFFIVAPNFGDLMYGTFVPTIPKGAMSSAIGLIGAVIMPHNLYLHSALVLSRKVERKNYKAVYEANIYNAVESGFSLFISFLISFAVIGTFAVYAGDPNH